MIEEIYFSVVDASLKVSLILFHSREKRFNTNCRWRILGRLLVILVLKCKSGCAKKSVKYLCKKKKKCSSLSLNIVDLILLLDPKPLNRYNSNVIHFMITDLYFRKELCYLSYVRIFNSRKKNTLLSKNFLLSLVVLNCL